METSGSDDTSQVKPPDETSSNSRTRLKDNSGVRRNDLSRNMTIQNKEESSYTSNSIMSQLKPSHPPAPKTRPQIRLGYGGSKQNDRNITSLRQKDYLVLHGNELSRDQVSQNKDQVIKTKEKQLKQWERNSTQREADVVLKSNQLATARAQIVKLEEQSSRYQNENKALKQKINTTPPCAPIDAPPVRTEMEADPELKQVNDSKVSGMEERMQAVERKVLEGRLALLEMKVEGYKNQSTISNPINDHAHSFGPGMMVPPHGNGHGMLVPPCSYGHGMMMPGFGHGMMVPNNYLQYLPPFHPARNIFHQAYGNTPPGFGHGTMMPNNVPQCFPPHHPAVNMFHQAQGNIPPGFGHGMAIRTNYMQFSPSHHPAMNNFHQAHGKIPSYPSAPLDTAGQQATHKNAYWRRGRRQNPPHPHADKW